MEIVHADDFETEGHDHSTHDHASVPDHVLPGMEYRLTTDEGEELVLEFSGYPPEAATGDRVTVRGERNGHRFKVSEMTEAAPGNPKGGGGGGSSKGGPKPKPPPTTYVGVRDMIVVAFRFDGSSVPPFTTDQIRASGFTGQDSVAAYFAETSFGQSTLKGRDDGTSSDRDGLPGDVTDWLTISGDTSFCDYSRWATSARSAATSAGWDLNGYEHIVYLFPKQTACSWSGLATVGGSSSWMNGTIDTGIFSHEIGHNFTLRHARTLICSSGGVPVSAGGSCSFDEYGDPFDVMGDALAQRHFNVRNKGHLAWFRDVNVVTASSGQTYTLFPLERASEGPQLLRIPIGRDYIYVEARAAHGFDSFTPTDDVVTGVLIHRGDDLASIGNSYLFDTAPSTASFADAALQAGEGFVEPVGNVYIETLAANPDGSMTVLVELGRQNAAPVVIGPGPSTMFPGIPHQTGSASVTDVDKNLSSYLWQWVSCPGTCPLLTNYSGTLSGGEATITGPLYSPRDLGPYQLSLTVWDAAGAATTVYVDETARI